MEKTIYKTKKGKEMEVQVLGDLSDEAKEFMKDENSRAFVDPMGGKVLGFTISRKKKSKEEKLKELDACITEAEERVAAYEKAGDIGTIPYLLKVTKRKLEAKKKEKAKLEKSGE